MREITKIASCIALAFAFACENAPKEPIGVARQAEVQHYIIQRPEVRQHVTPYPYITFQEGDIVLINAGGCYQTGGRGDTWKRFVDPTGHNAERLYHGLISIPGATAGLETIASVMARSPVVVGRIPANADFSQMFLRLGVDDDNYSDNGYWGRDSGTENQCLYQPDAWVEIFIQHGPPPAGDPPCPPMPVDLYWKALDANLLPLNPRWGTQCNSNPDWFVSPIDPEPLCNNFRTQPWHNLDLGPYCTRSLPTVDSKDAPFWCHADNSGVNGHVNFGFGTFTGTVYWNDWSSCIDPSDCDINIHLIAPHYEASARGNAREFGHPTVQLEFDARETIQDIPGGMLPWWRAFANRDNNYRRAEIAGKPAIASGVINFDNVHSPIQTELHPVLGFALKVTSTESEEVWAIMARRSGNQGGCSSNALHTLHDPELNELRFMLSTSPSRGSSVGSDTQFKWKWGATTGDTDFFVNFDSSGTLLRVPLLPQGRTVLGELHINRGRNVNTAQIISIVNAILQ